MKKIIVLLIVVSMCSGCLPLAVGYLGYKIADGNENSARIQAQVEREKLQMEREKVNQVSSTTDTERGRGK